MSWSPSGVIIYKGTFWVPFFNCAFFQHDVHLLVTLIP
ncbi:hypothetical protein KPK_1554 [Klebsiella variicola]|uniref:Uncharacterized protein n=1 Tax=Klebsiella variicola (strain 342) TaxID=507522 RepID=B5XP36_KLEV3|nr:hypothetical protein KPK_1554 [Klebsiella variicola]